MKVLMAYCAYPTTIARYIKEGLVDAGHEVTTLAHSTGSYQAWPGDPKFPGLEDVPDISLPNFSNLYMINGEVSERMASGEWDLFVNPDAAHHFCGHPLPIPKVIIGTDPHCLSYDHQRRCCDLFVNMQKCYSSPDDSWLPYAYSNRYHLYSSEELDHDLTFVGVEYATRKTELDALEEVCKVHRQCGVVREEYSKIYSRGWGAYARPSLRDLPARFFEGLATKNVVFTPKVPDLRLFERGSTPLLDGVHYISYSGADGLIDKVRWCMTNPEARDAIREAGYKWVQDHSWKTRAEQLIALVKEKGLV